MAELHADAQGHDRERAKKHRPPQQAQGDVVQHHPLRTYFIVWFWLFVLSAASYAVDVSGLEGLVKWSLIVFFMLMKAGLIVAVFMHMVWERLALAYAIILPPLVLLVFVAIMAFESDYVFFTRLFHFN